MKVYLIYDKRNKGYWSRGSKGAWLKRGSAKNAVMYDHGGRKSRVLDLYEKDEINPDWLLSDDWSTRYLKFDDQLRFECREFDISNITNWRKV